EQTSRGATPLTWSATGNLTGDDQGRAYFYDRQNKLTRVEDGASNLVAEYRYDALGRRVEKAVSGGATTRYYHDGQRVIEETDAAAIPQRAYAWGGTYIDELVQLIDHMGASPAAYFAL